MKILTLDEYKASLGIGVNGRTGGPNAEHILVLPADCTNDLVSTTMLETLQAARSARMADIQLRIEGEWKRYQADWLRYLRFGLKP